VSGVVNMSVPAILCKCRWPSVLPASNSDPAALVLAADLNEAKGLSA
jgi:hypothetical protein